MRFLSLLVAALLAGGCLDEGFCGGSTEAVCAFDSDCMTGGCSGQICQGVAEEPIISTCEFRACYEASSFGLGCGCVEGKCAWN